MLTLSPREETTMVVILAAALAYRYHCVQEGVEATEIERTISQQWQRTESLRKNSSEILQSALSCGAESSVVNEEPTPQQEQEQEYYTYTQTMSSSSSSSPSDEQPEVSEVVRKDWIDAVFGQDFFAFSSYKPPRQGVGMAQVPSFLAYTATIPSFSERKEKKEKVGMTLSNIAIGVYVQKVEPSSEAYVAGVEEGSILVSINHNSMGMLAEPTKQALERLWQYEGLFQPNHKEEGVVEMTFYKQGSLYSVLLLSGVPFGIQWASCGQFPLVQRAYSFAAQAGVRRGSLVAAINDTSMRNLNHAVAASLIQQLIQSQQEIHLTLCFTPAAARTSNAERATNTTTPNKRTAVSTDDGVEVRVHPLGYTIGTLLKGGATSPSKPRSERGGISELANQVANGTAVAPSGFDKTAIASVGPKCDRTYPPCPPLPSIVKSWNPWNALAYCFLFHDAKYHDLVAVAPNGGEYQVLEETSNYEPFLLACLNVVCECPSQPFMGKLLDQAEQDDGFCQCLYFLLKSIIATLEKQSRVDGDLIEMLQAAMLELTDRMQADKRTVVVPAKLQMTVAVAAKKEINGQGKATTSAMMQSTAAAVTEASGTNGGSVVPSQHASGKKKSVFRVFRKKGSKLSPQAAKSPKKSPKASKKSLPQAQQERPSVSPTPPATMTTSITSPSPPTTSVVPVSTLFDNMTRFLQELNGVCDTVERSLLKTISQKIADWALQPWSLSKHKALVAVTEAMRDALEKSKNLPVVNPIECCEVLTSVDPNECYILPSAHFPLLLTFNVVDKEEATKVINREKLYRTKVEVVSLRGSKKSPVKLPRRGSKGGSNASSLTSSRAFFVQGAVAGVVKESGRSTRTDSETSSHSWDKGSLLTFDTRSSWGAPQTLSLRLSSADVNDDLTHTDDSGTLHYSSVVGFCWVDLRPLWARLDSGKTSFATVMCHAQICSLDAMQSFDQHGDLTADAVPERFEIELRVTAEMLPFNEAASGFQSRKRMLLYKHDDDLRQELFAIEFVKTCDALLKASGLDLSLLTFRCIPVGARQGFIEWVPGSVPLSDICKPPDDVALSRNVSTESNVESVQQSTLSEVARAGLTKYQSLYRMEPTQTTVERGAVSNNPIQDFLRSAAYDPDAPYLIRKAVMDTYVKSCAGYCIVSYLLGVGDRHLDNLLLHQTGHFFHCDFSFILGEDPKKYLPVRITEDMVHGMGGKESDNYAMFLSLVGAAFLALRRHENVRVVLSLVRLMVRSKELSIHADPDEAVTLMRQRLCLNLSDTEAVSYIEELVETSISSKLWKAVDAIHSLGKRF